jgi:3'-phosphoadenosine 5'-phosphosulfate sulfotransferase (PAPS reductase)/FAD synthetase
VTDPFKITGPAVVANSGGKTSGFNLWKHLEANGGSLPECARAVFTNTGREHPATLDFLAEQERRWGVRIVWLEFCWRTPAAAELAKYEGRAGKARDRYLRLKRQPASFFVSRRGKKERKAVLFAPENATSLKRKAVKAAYAHAEAAGYSHLKAKLVGLPSYRVVSRQTASTDGRPFEEFLEGLRRFRVEVKNLPAVLPNGVQRLCTGHLKMRPSARFARDTWGVGPSGYECRLGLRADEQERIASAFKAKSHEAGRPVFPLDDAGVEKEDVAAFWAKQGWGLSLKSHEGNCDLCYMKRRNALTDLVRRGFGDVGWWRGWEAKTGARFRLERSYRGLEAAARTELSLLPPDDYDNAITCEGGYCSD